VTLNEQKTDNPQAAAAIDRVIHEPARYMIMAYLYVVESADFIFLLNQTGYTRGNLSSHIARLEESGYVEVIKEFVAKKPHTMLQLTPKGREAFEEYRKSLQQMLDELPK
jgi:DNA-binding MarR family transcriptional regulator